VVVPDPTVGWSPLECNQVSEESPGVSVEHEGKGLDGVTVFVDNGPQSKHSVDEEVNK
jgi:hypothetical protein